MMWRAVLVSLKTAVSDRLKKRCNMSLEEVHAGCHKELFKGTVQLKMKLL